LPPWAMYSVQAEADVDVDMSGWVWALPAALLLLAIVAIACLGKVAIGEMVAIAEKSESKLECEHECKSPVVDADLTRERVSRARAHLRSIDPNGLSLSTPSALKAAKLEPRTSPHTPQRRRQRLSNDDLAELQLTV